MSTFNDGEKLGETLDSIMRQEDVDFEIVVVNDGSTDHSGEILEKYVARDARIRVYSQENQGLTKSLIRGCFEARGVFIARHDVGDASDANRLSLQKSALESERELAFVSCWTQFCGPEWEFLYTIKGAGKAKTPAWILSEDQRYGVTDGPSHHGSVMFRKTFYEEAGGYRSEFYYGQ